MHSHGDDLPCQAGDRQSVEGETSLLTEMYMDLNVSIDSEYLRWGLLWRVLSRPLLWQTGIPATSNVVMGKVVESK